MIHNEKILATELRVQSSRSLTVKCSRTEAQQDNQTMQLEHALGRTVGFPEQAREIESHQDCSPAMLIAFAVFVRKDVSRQNFRSTRFIVDCFRCTHHHIGWDFLLADSSPLGHK